MRTDSPAMAQPPVTFIFTGYWPQLSEPVVQCTGPAAVVAEAARRFADVLDPWEDPTPRVELLTWQQWLSKLPGLRWLSR